MSGKADDGADRTAAADAAHVRVWRARTTADREADYLAVVRATVLPHLDDAPGFLGARFLSRAEGDDREILVITSWDSAENAGALGAEGTRAFVPDAIRATLTEVGESVGIFEVRVDHPGAERRT